MMLALYNDIQWYCIEYASSFNDLFAMMTNGDYLYAIFSVKSHLLTRWKSWLVN
jgi:hypothetical protein